MKRFEEVICTRADKDEKFVLDDRYAMLPMGEDVFGVIDSITDEDGILTVYKHDDEYSADIENEDEAVLIEYLKSEKRKAENEEAIANLEKEVGNMLGDNMMGKMFGQLTKSMTKQTMKNMGASKEETAEALKKIDEMNNKGY